MAVADGDVLYVPHDIPGQAEITVWALLLFCSVAFCLGASSAMSKESADAQTLLADLAAKIPLRPDRAPTGSMFAASVSGMDDPGGSRSIETQLTQGNIPGFLRKIEARPAHPDVRRRENRDGNCFCHARLSLGRFRSRFSSRADEPSHGEGNGDEARLCPADEKDRGRDFPAGGRPLRAGAASRRTADAVHRLLRRA